jgi:haloalkane dehalogenase
VKLRRAPDERFAALAGYAFEPHYVEVPTGEVPGRSGEDGATTIRIHYLDEGPAEAEETLLLLHGEPSWSYLYRKMVPPLIGAGYRVVVPDLVGFGRSDKPAERSDYTFARHVEWLRAALFDRLRLDGLTLFGQDWGGMIGLRLVAKHDQRFRRVVAANTGLPTGEGRVTDAFLAWQRFSQEVPEMPIGRIINGGTTTELAPEVIAAYDAPFPDESYKEGARQFPVLVPTKPDDPASLANRQAWDSLRRFAKPFLCAFSDGDPITAGTDRTFLRDVPGTKGMPHTTIAGAGHFLQEDKGEELAAVVIDFLERTPPR